MARSTPRTEDSPEDPPLVPAVVAWFDVHERPLPWRSTDPWGVLVSEFMLQQTPVDRVLPVWHAWMERWPDPEALARATVADALRAWGRLGYPRRARRLHETAAVIRDEHGGRVPDDEAALRALPGVGDYTAAAIRAFAFGQRSVVLDTNVRRVLARHQQGRALPPGHVTRAERRGADLLWPQQDDASARWSAAVMELGALVCTARSPQCDACPVQPGCRWWNSGRPEPDSPPRRQPRYEGSDRQVRGRLLALLRESTSPLDEADLADAWPEDEQRDRALRGLIDDHLVQRGEDGLLSLPG